MTDHVLGLDLSLRSTGAAAVTHDGRVTTWRKTTEAGDGDHDQALQIRDIARWARGLVTVSTRLVVVEAPSFGSQHGAGHERAGLWWMTRWYLARTEQLDGALMPVGRVAPSSLKHKIAGHGQASKDDMRRAILALYPRQHLARVSGDEIDAVALATVGVIKLAAADPAHWQGPWLDARALAVDTGTSWEHLDHLEREDTTPCPPAPATALAPAFSSPGTPTSRPSART